MARKVLLVDDDPDFCHLMEFALKASGYQVVVRSDGASGVTGLRGAKPDIALLDLDMPKGGGKLLYQTLRRSADFKDLPVIIISGNNLGGDVFEFLEEKPTPRTVFLRKPVDIEKLLPLVDKLCGKD